MEAVNDRVHTREAERKLLEVACRLYPSRAERAAMRGALMDAAGLLDALATDIAAQHFKRGRITVRGLELAAMVNDCANTVFAMREKIEVPRD
jgi:hypothetical protein